jgi:phosphate acetyltransferase
VSFADSLLPRAARLARRVVLPEGDDPRVRAAAARLAAAGVALELLGDVGGDPRLEACAAHLLARRADRFLARRRAAAASIRSRSARVSSRSGAADVMVGGAVHPTGDAVRAALWAVGPAAGVTTVSSAFYMERDDTVITFTDCAVVPEPTPEQLAGIAAAAARDRRRIVGDEPVVAFLSYSTHGSAAGARVDRVREAVARLAATRPDFAFDGELQGDAALVAEIAARKAPGSAAAGRANVLVFPDLDSGNIAYNWCSAGGWRAFGPVLQAWRGPWPTPARRHRRRYCQHDGDRGSPIGGALDELHPAQGF